MKIVFRPVLLGALIGFCCGITYAEEPAVQQVTVDINEPALSNALIQFTEQTGLQLIYPAGAGATNLQAPRLSGTFPTREALARLLKDSGLRYEFISPKTVAIQPEREGEAAGEISTSVGAEKASASRLNGTHLSQGDGVDSSKTPAVGSAEEQGGNASAGRQEIAEIVVTAQKREERLLETPISVGVLSGAELDRGSSRSVIDVLSQLGGVSLMEFAPGSINGIAIRGVISDTGSSTVGYYLDEVPFTYITGPAVPDANAFDLARVEVLRGSQGTLYGANALAGVIRILTNDASLDTFEVKGRTRVSDTEGGDSSNYGFDAAINVPLIEGKLAVRAVAGYAELGGFLDATFPGREGQSINSTRAKSYRLKVNYQPLDNLNLKLGWTRSDLHNDATSSAADDFTTSFPANQPEDKVYDVYNLIGEYKGSSVSLLSSTSYLDYSSVGETGFLLGGTAFLRVLTKNPLRSFAQELRLSSQLAGSWQWSAGAIYKDTNQYGSSQEDIDRAILPGVNHQTVASQSYAVFGEVVRAFNDNRFELTTGLRYFSDRLVHEHQSGFFPTSSLASPQRVDSEKVTGRLILSYKPDHDSMFYGSVATGFRSGVSQTVTTRVFEPTFPGVEPDELTTYEMGTKGQVADGRLAYQTAIYYQDWKDIQQNVGIPAGFAAFLNAGSASGIGADVTVSYRPVPSFLLEASLGWNNLEFGEDVFQSVSTAQVDVLTYAKDTRLNDSPEWTGSIGSELRLPTMMTGVDFVLSGNFAYSSARLGRFLSGTTLLLTESDSIRNLKASAALQGERWGVSLYGDNLTNFDGAMSPPSPTGGGLSVRLRPRTIGLQATYDY